MRKYQQLVLLLISVLSVGVLLMYQSENKRLKYVLQVVNFFGRTDIETLRMLGNLTEFETEALTEPLPVWQHLGGSFHAYGAYWLRKYAGSRGAAMALVVGQHNAIVNFSCTFIYASQKGIEERVEGRFHFERTAPEVQATNGTDDFDSYRFHCLNARISQQAPNSVVFVERQRSSGTHLYPKLRLHQVTPAVRQRQPSNASFTTLCLDLFSPMQPRSFDSTPSYARQFFLWHNAMGVTKFLVYNYEALPTSLVAELQRTNIRVRPLPFNFPYPTTGVDTDTRIRRIIEDDCLLRQGSQGQLTTLLQLNEFYYANSESGALQRHYEPSINRFELPTLAVCLGAGRKLLVDHELYDPSAKAPHKLFLYRLNAPILQLLQHAKSIALPLNDVMGQRYVDCEKLGLEGLSDWRKSTREDFLKYINELRAGVAATF